jgi:hypothetical protein
MGVFQKQPNSYPYLVDHGTEGRQHNYVPTVSAPACPRRLGGSSVAWNWPRRRPPPPAIARTSGHHTRAGPTQGKVGNWSSSAFIATTAQNSSGQILPTLLLYCQITTIRSSYTS